MFDILVLVWYQWVTAGSKGFSQGPMGSSEIKNTVTSMMMTTKSVSMIFGILDYQYLKRSRMSDGPPGPPYVKRNGRVYYDRSDVEAFIESLKIRVAS